MRAKVCVLVYAGFVLQKLYALVKMHLDSGSQEMASFVSKTQNKLSDIKGLFCLQRRTFCLLPKRFISY